MTQMRLLTDASPVKKIIRAKEHYRPVLTFALFSGGNDSTIMLDIARPYIDAVIHVNTGIGIRATREFVRKTCATWDLELLELHPPKLTYEQYVMRYGFPGPADHFWAYAYLKKEALRSVRRQYAPPRSGKCVMFLTGMRAPESAKRSAHGALDRLEEGIAWINPIRTFTADDMAEYRREHPELPVNPVTLKLGKSGECLCGSFSLGPVEKEIVRELDSETAAQIDVLEAQVATVYWSKGEKNRRWGPGGPPGRRAGRLCSCGPDTLF